jgi:hypothetical protein
MGWDDISALATGIVILGAALAALTKWVIVPAAVSVKRWARFMSDWEGEEPRPGVPGRSGVMARLESIEHKTERAEFHLGNGNPVPLRSLVDEHGLQLVALKEQVEVLTAQQAVATSTPE